VRFAHIDAEKANHSVSRLCRTLEVSRSGFYAWAQHATSARAKQDQRLVNQLRVLHAASQGCYGSPRLWRDLVANGEHVSRKRVARLMQEQGLVGRRRRRHRKTTDSAHAQPVAANVVNRQFAPAQLNRVWAGDITYIRTWEGWLFLAVVLDLRSRRVVGWAVADHMRTELVLEALRGAVLRRRPAAGLVHHSDRGSQYASADYRQALAQYGMQQSMSRKGNCWDNAVVESFFGTLKEELIYRGSWPTRQMAASAIGKYIDGFYNLRRRHSTLGYISPIEFERAGKVLEVAA
jgi:transposase InsO family protein